VITPFGSSGVSGPPILRGANKASVYRFQAHFRIDKGGSPRYVKFVADIRPELHDHLNLRIQEFVAMSHVPPRRYLYSQREVFIQLWNTWQSHNPVVAAKLPAKFPDNWLALKKLRTKERGQYSNPMLLRELWDAWCSRFPGDAGKIERRVKLLLKEAKESSNR
jgi:hypothetical protein